jgi:hypothetical protein
MTSLEVSRGTQIVRHHHMAGPRRRLSGGTDGKTAIPAKTVLQQIADIPKTPDIQAGVVKGSAAMHNLGPQVTVTEEEEGKSNAGGFEGNTTIPAKKFLQQVSDILKTPLIQAGVVSHPPPGRHAQAVSDVGGQLERAHRGMYPSLSIPPQKKKARSGVRA